MLVWYQSFTNILSRSTTIPTSSKPMFSKFDFIPTAESTISASKISSPFLVLTLAFIVFPEVSTLSTEEFVITLIPAFLNERSNCFDTSSSSRGTKFGKYSTIVTLVPMAL